MRVDGVTTAQDIDLYSDTVTKEGLYASKSRLAFHMDVLFGKIDLAGKRVLDIGGGSGYDSFYAACQSANKVVCLEPEAEGSSAAMTANFTRLMRRLKRPNVELLPVTIQAFDPAGETFDVILLYNSITIWMKQPA